MHCWMQAGSSEVLASLVHEAIADSGRAEFGPVARRRKREPTSHPTQYILTSMLQDKRYTRLTKLTDEV